MKKIILIFLNFFIMLFLCSCVSNNPENKKFTCISYEKNYKIFDTDVNQYSLFDQFRYDDVKVSFSDGKIILNIFDIEYSGVYEKTNTPTHYVKEKNKTYFNLKFDDSLEGEAYSRHYILGGDTKLGIYFNDKEYTFSSDWDESYNENYDFDNFIMEQYKIVTTLEKNNSFIRNIEAYYNDQNVYYQGKIITIDGNFYFRYDEGEDFLLDLTNIFFYTLENNTIVPSDKIIEGNVIFKGFPYIDSRHLITSTMRAVFYLS